MHSNCSVESHIHAMNGDEIEKVDEFLYLGGYTNLSVISLPETDYHGILKSLEKFWNSRIITKIKILKSTTEFLLLYRCESWIMTNAAGLDEARGKGRPN